MFNLSNVHRSAMQGVRAIFSFQNFQKKHSEQNESEIVPRLVVTNLLVDLTSANSITGDSDLPEELFELLSDIPLEELEERFLLMEKAYRHIRGLAAYAHTQLQAQTLSKETTAIIFSAIEDSACWGERLLEDRFFVEGCSDVENCGYPATSQKEKMTCSSEKEGSNG